MSDGDREIASAIQRDGGVDEMTPDRETGRTDRTDEQTDRHGHLHNCIIMKQLVNAVWCGCLVTRRS